MPFKKVLIRNALITELRKGKGWSRQELAEKAQINRQNIYNAEWGNGVSVVNLVKIAYALDVPVADLIEVQ